MRAVPIMTEINAVLEEGTSVEENRRDIQVPIMTEINAVWEGHL